jgi:hypothetical protein
MGTRSPGAWQSLERQHQLADIQGPVASKSSCRKWVVGTISFLFTMPSSWPGQGWLCVARNIWVRQVGLARTQRVFALQHLVVVLLVCWRLLCWQSPSAAAAAAAPAAASCSPCPPSLALPSPSLPPAGRGIAKPVTLADVRCVHIAAPAGVMEGAHTPLPKRRPGRPCLQAWCCDTLQLDQDMQLWHTQVLVCMCSSDSAQQLCTGLAEEGWLLGVYSPRLCYSRAPLYARYVAGRLLGALRC